jgi:hypothetical protein
MKQGFAWSVALVLALGGQAHGQGKVYTVGKDGVKIEGEVDGTDNKVNIRPDATKDESHPLPAKMYSVKLKAGTNFRMRMESTDFDSVLVVQDPDGKQVSWDDDSGGGLNSQLDFQPAKDGTYKVYAASLKGQGKFTLTVRQAEAPKAAEVGKGLRATGKLGGNMKLAIHLVRLVEGKTYQIDMKSADAKALDPFLALINPGGQHVAHDDDSGGDLNARLVFRAPLTGTYRIVATSFMGRGNGDYTLEVREKE